MFGCNLLLLNPNFDYIAQTAKPPFPNIHTPFPILTKGLTSPPPPFHEPRWINTPSHYSRPYLSYIFSIFASWSFCPGVHKLSSRLMLYACQ
jgi:hypothetical protein